MTTDHETETTMTPTPRPQGRVAAALTAATLLITTLAGCGGTGTAPAADPGCFSGTGLVLVVPVHQNAQAPGVPQEWDCALDTAIRSSAPVSVVTSEGVPQVLLKEYVADISTENPLAADDDTAAAKSAVVAAVAAATATSDGNDTLAALSLAADLAPGGQILSADNGASDTGVVRTADPGMTTAINAADVAQQVVDLGSCPAVEGQHVSLYSLGYQVAPARPISQRQRDTVTATWQLVLEACGAVVDTVAAPRTGDGPPQGHVSVAIEPEPDPVVAIGSDADPGTDCEVVLPDSAVGFVAEQATLLEPERARGVVAEVAAHLAACPGKVEVLGTTSSAGTEQGRKALSTLRAELVRDLLAAELGVPPTTIEATGLGYDITRGGCVEDRFAGVLDPILAGSNRKVLVRVVEP